MFYINAFICHNETLCSMQLEALIHPFFDELRDPNTRLPNGRFLPPLFNFKPHGNDLELKLFFQLNYFSCLLLLCLMIVGCCPAVD